MRYERSVWKRDVCKRHGDIRHIRRQLSIYRSPIEAVLRRWLGGGREVFWYQKWLIRFRWKETRQKWYVSRVIIVNPGTTSCFSSLEDLDCVEVVFCFESCGCSGALRCVSVNVVLVGHVIAHVPLAPAPKMATVFTIMFQWPSLPTSLMD